MLKCWFKIWKYTSNPVKGGAVAHKVSRRKKKTKTKNRTLHVSVTCIHLMAWKEAAASWRRWSCSMVANPGGWCCWNCPTWTEGVRLESSARSPPPRGSPWPWENLSPERVKKKKKPKTIKNNAAGMGNLRWAGKRSRKRLRYCFTAMCITLVS